MRILMQSTCDRAAHMTTLRAAGLGTVLELHIGLLVIVVIAKEAILSLYKDYPQSLMLYCRCP